eukprot:6173330-Pleurochrysis_carterae.AAC.2
MKHEAWCCAADMRRVAWILTKVERPCALVICATREASGAVARNTSKGAAPLLPALRCVDAASGAATAQPAGVPRSRVRAGLGCLHEGSQHTYAGYTLGCWCCLEDCWRETHCGRTAARGRRIRAAALVIGSGV